MKVGIFNTFDLQGGAARAAYRLHRGLLERGNQSTMLVQRKQSDDSSVEGPKSKGQIFWSSMVSSIDSLPFIRYPKREGSFSTGWLNSLNVNQYSNNFDVFNFHWVVAGFQSISSISKLNKPLVLTLHDSWYFTGGCHIPFECEKFTDKCGDCPQLKSNHSNDLSRREWERKIDKWKRKSNIVLVGDGNWVANNARKSSIFKDHRIEVIHPGLDLEVYKPHDKKFSRSVLGFSDTDIIILFGAVSATSDVNKGFHLLIPALKRLIASYPEAASIKVVIFGASSSTQSNLDIEVDIRYIGKLTDDISLSVLYSAADVMIVPSVQECFGQTASESFACGTPVVAFNTSGLKDIIDHQINGFLATPYDPADLADGIAWVLADNDRKQHLARAARSKAVANFGLDRYVSEYLNVYNSIL